MLMKRFTSVVLLILSVVFTAMAGIDTSKEYMIKYSDGTYLNVLNHSTHASGAYGGVNLAALDGSSSQIFIFEESGDGYKLRCKDGYYINCYEWNVDANSTVDGSVLYLEPAAGEMEYLIKWYNTYKNGEKYFKVGLADGGSNYYPYGDAPKANAAVWTLVEYQDPALIGAKDVLIAEITAADQLLALTGSNPGEYTAEQTAVLVEPLAVAKGVLENGSTVAADYTDAAAALKAVVDGLALTPNPVVAGTYMIVSACEGFGSTVNVISCYGYDTYHGADVTLAWTQKDENDPLQYWTLEDNNDGTFNIKATYEGSYIANYVGTDALGTTAKAATFKNLPLAQFNITLRGESKPLHCNGWNWGTSAAPLTVWDGVENTASAWKLVKVDAAPEFSHTISVDRTGYATLMLGFNAEIPEGVTVLAVESVENSNLVVKEYTEGVIAANVAVIIKAQEGEYAFTSAADAATITESVLKGSLFKKTIGLQGAGYVLGNDGENAVFAKAAIAGANFVNDANEAYLDIASDVVYYSIGADTTSIDEIAEQVAEDAVFDITGRKVEKISAPGIYIVNGKKVLVK